MLFLSDLDGTLMDSNGNVTDEDVECIHQWTQKHAFGFVTGRDSVTLTGTINYIKPGRGGKLIGIAQEISSGRTTGVYEVFIFNDENVLLSRATFTMFFLDSDKMKKKKEQK